MDYYSQIQDYFNLNNILINETQLTLLSNYAQLLKEKNEIINLISRKDTDNIIENHIFHSLLLTKYITENEFNFIGDAKNRVAEKYGVIIDDHGKIPTHKNNHSDSSDVKDNNKNHNKNNVHDKGSSNDHNNSNKNNYFMRYKSSE